MRIDSPLMNEWLEVNVIIFALILLTPPESLLTVNVFSEEFSSKTIPLFGIVMRAEYSVVAPFCEI